MKYIIDKTKLPALTAIIILVVLIIHLLPYQYAFDDAFIHFRVARNFVENGKPYYNVGEAVKVSTSSGWSIFLAIIFKLVNLVKFEGYFPFIIRMINSFILLIGMYIYTRLLENLRGEHFSEFTSLMFQISYVAILLPSSIGLMETPFALLLTGIGIYLLAHERHLGFMLLGFAVYTRLELTILLILISALMLFQRQLQIKRFFLCVGLGLVPMLVYDMYFFRTIIPHSVIAKAIVYALHWVQPVVYIIFSSLPSIPVENSYVVPSLIGTVWISSIVVTVIAIIREWKRARSMWPMLFCLWGLLVLGGYIAGHTLIFPWYGPLYTLPLIIACFLCLDKIPNPSSNVIKGLLYIMFGVSIVSILSALYMGIRYPNSTDITKSNAKVKVYLAVGSILYREYPDANLLTSEIGGLGYAFKGKIFDAAGLASPDALKFHPMKIPEQRSSGTVGAIPPDYVKENMPDIIVSYDFFAEALLRSEVISQYNVVLIPSNNNYLRIYLRKDLPISENIAALAH